MLSQERGNWCVLKISNVRMLIPRKSLPRVMLGRCDNRGEHNHAHTSENFALTNDRAVGCAKIDNLNG